MVYVTRLISAQIGPVRQAVGPYLDVLLPLFFVGFFLAALFAMVHHTDPGVRRTYVSGLFVLVVVVNVVGVTVPPLAHWQKFAQDYPPEQTVYEIRVVDATGNELHYDHRATLRVDGVTVFVMQRELVGDLPREAKVERAQFLLERATGYRARIESRSPLHLLRFPPHGVDNIWTEERLDGYAEFVGIRVYRIDGVTDASGSEWASVSETLVMEYLREEGLTDALEVEGDDRASTRFVPG